jgi:hypothetical protein
MSRYLKQIGYKIACTIAFCSAAAASGRAASPADGGAAKAAHSATVVAEQVRVFRRGGRLTVETQNLRIHGIGKQADAAAWARQCERLRTMLAERWLGARQPQVWSPKCDIVLHGTLAEYLRAVGADQASTIGASLIDRAGDRIILRRIDIRADRAGWLQGALAHELTHAILADEFAREELPLWADEGMAVLADPAAKQALHLRDFHNGLRRGSSWRLAEFLSGEAALSREQIPVFYGQSLSLVKFLVDRKTPADFVSFLRRAREVGYDAALRDCYVLDGVADLERQWRRPLTGSKPTRNVFSVVATPLTLP